MRRARSPTGWEQLPWKPRRIRVVPKAPRLEDRLAALSDLRRDPNTPEARTELTKCLASKINLLAAKAARIVGECKLDDMASQVADALPRFFVDPVASDRR